MIEDYFAQVKAIVDQYAAASFVLEALVSFETRPGEQGYLEGAVTFMDRSVLHFKEFLDRAGEAVDKLMYSYHYHGTNQELIFRYDNARHRPSLPSREHKHLPEEIVAAPAPTLEAVLTEIIVFQGWV